MNSWELKNRDIYNKLFKDYSDKQFEDSIQLFIERFKKWKIVPMKWFEGKTCLDVGCGQGRYLIALGRLKAKKAIGIDINDYAIKATKERPQFKEFKNIEIRKSSALDIPFNDSTFDFVICSGVAHHTPNPKKVFDECTRVLKKNGIIYFAVYGKYWYWKLNNIFRIIAKAINFRTAVKLCEIIGIPANKRYNYLDNVYVPYWHTFREETIFEWADLDYKYFKRIEPKEKRFMRFIGVK